MPMPIILHHQHMIEVYPVKRSQDYLAKYDFSLYSPDGEFLEGGKDYPSEDAAIAAAKQFISLIEAQTPIKR